MNPVNDFYMRNAQAQMSPQFNQPYQQTFNFPPTAQIQQPVIRASWVTSVEEAKASQMTDFTATFVYADTSTGKLYLKKMGNNGMPQFLSYVLENDVPEGKDPLSEINARLSNIENFLGGLRNEPVSGNADARQPAGSAQPAVAVADEPDATAEPAGVPKNAGNDFWKKRK